MKRWSVLFLALALWALAGCGGPAAPGQRPQRQCQKQHAPPLHSFLSPSPKRAAGTAGPTAARLSSLVSAYHSFQKNAIHFFTFFRFFDSFFEKAAKMPPGTFQAAEEIGLPGELHIVSGAKHIRGNCQAPGRKKKNPRLRRGSPSDSVLTARCASSRRP